MDPTERQPGSEIEKCPTCGTTRITFDPPLVFEAGEACGVIKPGTYVSSPPGGIPTCEREPGHDGDHIYLVEHTVTWSNHG